MTAIKDLIKTINDIKQNEKFLSETDMITLLKATKSIVHHNTHINAYLSLLKSVEKNKLSKLSVLTKRELQVLKAIGHGNNSASISKKLNISIHTIETHRKNIRKKLELVGQGTLFEYALFVI